jgi:hypothetical protein
MLRDVENLRSMRIPKSRSCLSWDPSVILIGCPQHDDGSADDVAPTTLRRRGVSF